MNAIYVGEFNPPNNLDKKIIENVLNNKICKTQLDIKNIYIIPEYINESNNSLKYNFNDRVNLCKDFFKNNNNVIVSDICGLVQNKNFLELFEYLKNNKTDILNNFYIIFDISKFEKILNNNIYRNILEDMHVILIGNEDDNRFHIYKTTPLIRYAFLLEK